jgi:hypothetical protein
MNIQLTEAEARVVTLALAQYTIELVRELRTTRCTDTASRVSAEIVECGGILNKLPRVRAPE